MSKIIICFETTRRLNSTEIVRLCNILSKRSEYRDAYTIVPRYAYNESGFCFQPKLKPKPKPNKIVAKTFVILKNGEKAMSEKKYVYWHALTFHEANDIHAFTFQTVDDAPVFTEREMVFWLTCFDLFGIVLAKSEKKWRILLKYADVAEKLRNIPRPTSFIVHGYLEPGRDTIDVVLPHPDDKKKKFILIKYINLPYWQIPENPIPIFFQRWF